MKSVSQGLRVGDDPATYACFDVHPDGTIPPGPDLGTRMDPSHLFPRLPRTPEEAKKGWSAYDERDDATITYKPRPAEPGSGRFDFEADQVSYMEKIYEGSDRRIFHFDGNKGRITGAEITRSFGSHINGKGTGTLELKSVETLEPAKLATFAAEMDRYFAYQRAYLALYRKAETSGAEAEELLKKGRALLAEARAKLTLPEPIAALDVQIKNHDQFAKYQVEGAKKFAEILGKPSPDWEIKDLDGKTHTLAQHRGKVVVLDFWYRGCGWCMRAMPQVKRVAKHYQGKPVAVFGANNDRVEDDAKFVVRAMPIEYPVLRSMDLPGKFGVQGFPTLVIIDKEGKVADIHVGYSPELFEEVTAVVDRLLDAKK
jgi:thiol-disulfide isomerase/thioredoxin